MLSVASLALLLMLTWATLPTSRPLHPQHLVLSPTAFITTPTAWTWCIIAWNIITQILFSCLSSHHQCLRLPTLTNPRSAIRHLHTLPHIPILCSPIMPTRALRHPKPCNLRNMSSFQIRTRALWSPTKTSLLMVISRLISIVPLRFLNLEIAVRRHSCK